MAWRTLPVVDAVRREHWNELVAAANERNDASLKAAALAEIAGQVPRVGQVTAIRQRVEALIPYFYDWDTGAAWTKATCLQAAIGKVDWTTPVLSHKKAVRAPHVDEIKKVLDLLSSLRVAEAGGTSDVAQFRYPNNGYGWTWNASWSDGKGAYAGSAWGSGSFGALAGLSNLAMELHDPTSYHHQVRHYRCHKANFSVPTGLPTVEAAHVTFRPQGTIVAPVAFQWYEQANFGGAAAAFTWSGVGSPEVDVAIPGAGLAERSFRTQTDLYSSAELDAYRPPDVNNAAAGFLIDRPVMVLKLGFEYLA